MAIILPQGLTSDEIRVLQEFRRTNTETMSVEAIKAIKHPAGGGEGPAVTLVSKGYLTPAADNGGFAMTPRGKEFISFDPVPLYDEPLKSGDAAASAAENPEADGV